MSFSSVRSAAVSRASTVFLDQDGPRLDLLQHVQPAAVRSSSFYTRRSPTRHGVRTAPLLEDVDQVDHRPGVDFSRAPTACWETAPSVRRSSKDRVVARAQAALPHALLDALLHHRGNRIRSTPTWRWSGWAARRADRRPGSARRWLDVHHDAPFARATAAQRRGPPGERETGNPDAPGANTRRRTPAADDAVVASNQTSTKSSVAATVATGSTSPSDARRRPPA